MKKKPLTQEQKRILKFAINSRFGKVESDIQIDVRKMLKDWGYDE